MVPMRIRPIVRMVAALLVFQAVTLHAQITSARALTKRIAPLTGQPVPPARPPHASEGAAAGPAAAVPLDPKAAAAAKEEAQAELTEAEQKKLEWLKSKADGGSPFAQYELGVKQMTGDGSPVDLVSARKYLEDAKKNGYAQADDKLKELSELEKSVKESAKTATTTAPPVPPLTPAPSAPSKK